MSKQSVSDKKWAKYRKALEAYNIAKAKQAEAYQAYEKAYPYAEIDKLGAAVAKTRKAVGM